MKHTNDVTTAKIIHIRHSGLHYIGKNLYHKSIHIQMMIDTWFHCSHRHSPDIILGFLQISVMQKEVAHQLHCHLLILILVQNFIGFIVLVVIPQIKPLFSSNFCDTRISTSSVTLSLLDCSSCILSCNSTRRF